MSVSRRTLSGAVLLIGLLGCLLARPSYANLYTTAITTAQAPGVYTGSTALGGLYDACTDSTNPDASPDNREALWILSPALFDMVVGSIPSGQYYLGGYYDETTDAWYWQGRRDGQGKVSFATGPTAVPINTVVASNWSTGYPQMATGTSAIGANKYMVYDASLKGWINVDGTAALNGVGCLSNSVYSEPKKKFPWWAILIIVLGCVVIIAVVVVVVVCCCCCKKKKRYTDDDDDASAFTSRSGSFTSRGTSRTGSSYTGTGSTSSGSFSSRGSSFTGSSKGSRSSGSSGTGSSSTGSSMTGSSRTGGSSSGSSMTGSSATGSTSTGVTSRSSSFSSRGSSRSGTSHTTDATSTHSGTSSTASSSVASSADGSRSTRSSL